MKKFKHWLIKKLGGYVEVAPPIISQRTIEPVTIYVSTGVPINELVYNFAIENAVRESLAHQLAKEIINRGLCEIVRAEDPHLYVMNFKTSIKIIPQKWREGE
jgi:hypothetical protein